MTGCGEANVVGSGEREVEVRLRVGVAIVSRHLSAVVVANRIDRDARFGVPDSPGPYGECIRRGPTLPQDEHYESRNTSA